jgi:hypothetical protein
MILALAACGGGSGSTPMLEAQDPPQTQVSPQTQNPLPAQIPSTISLPFTIDGGVLTTIRGQDTTITGSLGPFVLAMSPPITIPGQTGRAYERSYSDIDMGTGVINLNSTKTVVSYTDKRNESDTDYIDFGYWLWKDELLTGLPEPETRVGVKPFAFSTHPYGSVESLVGEAEYTGPATGYYALRHTTVSGRPPYREADGQFAATVMMTADFDDYAISATVSEFRDGAGQYIFKPDQDTQDYKTWELEFPNVLIDPSHGTFLVGSATEAHKFSGTFDGKFHPDRATGEFAGRFSNGSVQGAFSVLSEPAGIGSTPPGDQ